MAAKERCPDKTVWRGELSVYDKKSTVLQKMHYRTVELYKHSPDQDYFVRICFASLLDMSTTHVHGLQGCTGIRFCKKKSVLNITSLKVNIH